MLYAAFNIIQKLCFYNLQYFSYILWKWFSRLKIYFIDNYKKILQILYAVNQPLVYEKSFWTTPVLWIQLTPMLGSQTIPECHVPPGKQRRKIFVFSLLSDSFSSCLEYTWSVWKLIQPNMAEREGIMFVPCGDLFILVIQLIWWIYYFNIWFYIYFIYFIICNCNMLLSRYCYIYVTDLKPKLLWPKDGANVCKVVLNIYYLIIFIYYIIYIL